MKKFNKSLLAKNIRFLATQKGIKIGELEAEAQVSSGYLSRMLKIEDGGTSSSLMDLIVLASSKLDISVDSLLEMDYQNLTPNETYLDHFFEHIFQETQEGSRSWNFETEDMLLQYPGKYPSPFVIAQYDNMDYVGVAFESKFNPKARLGSGCVYSAINGHLLYIVKTIEEGAFGDEFGYEVYMSDNQKKDTDAMVRTFPEDALYSIIDNIFKEASKASHQVKITRNVRTIIDTYLNPPKDEEDLPF